MIANARQLSLDLGQRPAMGREDFLISGSNAAAVDMVDGWPDWPHRALAILGPAGSGKSHLVEVWRGRAGGAVVSAAELCESMVGAAEAAGALAVEDVDRGIADERILFHLFNLARETRLSLLLTMRVAPGDIEIALPDLRSRLRATAFVSIESPDEALLKGLLIKLFADRQLRVTPKLVDFIARHLERSAEGAARVVSEIDKLALETRRNVGLRVAREALDRLAAQRSD